MNKNFCIIMAGGVGSRFWPVSRNAKPKQFLDILGKGQSLLRQTFNRFTSICPPENIYIVTSSEYASQIADSLPEVPAGNLLLEPIRRNTAPCITYACYKIRSIHPDANIVVTPSDHLIEKEDEFQRVIHEALEFTEKHDALLALGIKPSRPETGYGYIQVNGYSESNPNIKKAKTFTEKPDVDMARIFYESGEFYWNSGIFIWNIKAIIAALETHLPDINDLFRIGSNFYNSPSEKEFIKKTYGECRNISIDYGVMEKAKNVYVLCADFGWSDLGTWGSLYEHMPKDDQGNAVQGDNVIAYNSANCIIHAPEKKLVVIEGLDDFILVESGDILLLCKKQNEQHLRQVVNDVKAKKGEEFI